MHCTTNVLVVQCLFHHYGSQQAAHFPDILFAAPLYWWDWLAAPELKVRYKGDCHVSSTSPGGINNSGTQALKNLEG
jgi:hypothetical protein